MSTPEFTEHDWLNSADPILLLDHLFPMHGFHSTPEQPRKLRLYYAACARRVRDRLSGVHFAMIDAIERLADGGRFEGPIAELMLIGEELTQGRIDEAEATLRLSQLLDCEPAAYRSTKRVPGPERERIDWLLYQGLRDVVPAPSWVHRSLHSADLVRDVFTNPFRKPVWHDEWRTDDALRIAQGMYDSRAFRSMGQLADALEEAGCQEPAVLLHCREEFALHTRGCWVVDFLLARESGTITSVCSS